MSKFEPGKFVTAFCDASYCPDTNAAGFGLWIKHGEPVNTFRHAGKIPDATNSTDAEYKALVAVYNALANEAIETTGKVLVVSSDCIAALNEFERHHNQDLYALGFDYVKYKHVYGHNGYKNARSAVNTFCDKQAKFHMRAMRDE